MTFASSDKSGVTMACGNCGRCDRLMFSKTTTGADNSNQQGNEQEMAFHFQASSIAEALHEINAILNRMTLLTKKDAAD